MDVGVWLRDLGLGQYEAAIPRQRDRRRGSAEPDGRRPRKDRASPSSATGARSCPRSRAERSARCAGRSGSSARDADPGAWPTPPSGASSPSCSPTSSARPRCRPGSIPRTCARSSAPTRTPARAWWRATTASSRNSWATAFSPISAFRARMRTMRRGRSTRGSRSPRPSRRLQTRAREKLAVRVGIATGLVVVGDLVGQGSAQEQAVVGDTPNLAARLQGLAEAGGVVVSASTRRLIGDRFRLKDLGRHAVKGLAEPVEAFAALGVSASESRFEAAHAARLAGFVGREAESADLLARQRRAWGGQGQIVLISGEAGIGKSRLAAWLAEQVAETPHTRLRYQCSPYHRDSALYPFVQQLERAAGIAPQEPAEAKLDKLEQVLGLATDRMSEVAPLIASMLSIPIGSPLSPARPLARAAASPDAFGAARPDGGPREEAAGADAVRGRALGRRDLARSARSRDRARAAAAGADADHLPPGIRGAVEGPARRRRNRAAAASIAPRRRRWSSA